MGLKHLAYGATRTRRLELRPRGVVHALGQSDRIATSPDHRPSPSPLISSLLLPAHDVVDHGPSLLRGLARSANSTGSTVAVHLQPEGRVQVAQRLLGLSALSHSNHVEQRGAEAGAVVVAGPVLRVAVGDVMGDLVKHDGFAPIRAETDGSTVGVAAAKVGVGTHTSALD